MPLIQDYNKLFEHTDDIKKVILNGNIVWPAAKPASGPDYTEPFYSENTTDQTESVTFYRNSDSAPTFDIYYSLDKGNTWNFCGSTAESFTYRNPAHTKVWFCAETTQWNIGYYGISIRDCKKVGGNIMSLLYGRNFTGQEANLPSYSHIFERLFTSNTTLIDASELLLPATTLANYCYSDMFSYCTSLTTAPELPATTLASYCYDSMFRGCTSLTTAPVLPATTLIGYCYQSMFSGCTSLIEITCYATSRINTNYSTNYWLLGVSSTGTFTKAAGATWPTGNNGIPSGWAVVEV